jgi:hypothetical protein
MKTITTLVLLLALAGAVGANEKDVLVKTDKFTGRTTVMMKPITLGAFIDDLSIVSLGLAAETAPDGRVILVIECDASRWQFLQGADVYALADGQRIDLGHFVPQQGTVSATAHTSEAITGYVELPALAQMANAKDLQLKVGRYECHVKPKNGRHLKEFSDALAKKN